MSKPNQNCTLRKKSKNNYNNFTKFSHHKNSEHVVSVRRCAGFLISKDDANSDGGQYKHELKPELDLDADADSESNLMNYNQASDSNRYNRVVDSASSNTNIESESDSDSQSKLQYYNIDIDSKKNINYHKSTTPTSNVNRRTTMDRVKGCARDIKNKFLNLVTTGSDNMIISLFSNLGLSIVFTGIFLGILWAVDMLLKSYFGYTIRCCYCSKQSKDLDSAERNSVQNSNSNSTEGPGNESNANVIRNADPNLQDNHNATSSTDDKESDKKSCTSYCSLKPLNDCNHFLRHCDLTGNSNSVTSNLNLKESVSCGSVPDRLPPGCMIDGQTISTLAIRCGVPNFTHRYENYGSTITNSNHRRRFQLYNNRICVGELVIATTPRGPSQTGTLTSNQIQSESRENGAGIIDPINSVGGMIINPNHNVNNNSFNFNNSSSSLSSGQSNIHNMIVTGVDGRNQMNSNLMILSQPVTDINDTHMNHTNSFNFQSNSLSDRGELLRASLVEPNSATVLGQNRMESAYERGHSSNSNLNFQQQIANSNHRNVHNLNHSTTNYHPHFVCTDNATDLRQMQFTNSHVVQPSAYVTFVNSQDPSRSITALSNSNIVTERTLTQNHNNQLIAGYHGQYENVFQAQSQITDDRVQNQFYRDHQHILGNHNANYNTVPVNSDHQRALGNHNANYNTVPVNSDHQNVIGNHNANYNILGVNSGQQHALGNHNANHNTVRIINSYNQAANACGDRDKNHIGMRINSDHLKQNACGSRDNNYNGVTVPVNTNSDHQNACGSRDNNYNGVTVPVDTNSDHQNACGSRDNNYNGVPVPVNTNSDHQNACGSRDNNYNGIPINTKCDHQNASVNRDNNYNGVTVPVDTNSDHQNARGSRDNNYNGVPVPVNTNSDHQNASGSRDNNYNDIPVNTNSDHQNAGAIRDNNNYNVTLGPQIKNDHTNVEPQNCDSHGGTGAGAVPWRGVRSRTISAEAEDE